MKRLEGVDENFRKMSEALRRKIRGAGLSLREAEGLAGIGKDYLRHLLSGRVDLKIRHVLGILEILKIDPGAFFAEVYEVPRSPLDWPREPLHPQFPGSQYRVRSGAVWFLARKLMDHGILSNEDAATFVAEFDRDQTRLY